MSQTPPEPEPPSPIPEPDADAATREFAPVPPPVGSPSPPRPEPAPIPHVPTQPALAPKPPPHSAGPGMASEVRELGLGALESLTPSMSPATPAELTARVGGGLVPATESHRRWTRLQVFNWRLALVRLLCSGLAVVLTVLIIPGLALTDWQFGDFTILALVFGLLNALVKPVLQFLVLRFIFSTYGFVVVLINTFLLWALDQITDGIITIRGILPALLGGLSVGVLGLVFETVLGANPPIMDSRSAAAGEGTQP